jgi:hypothetical protein
MRTQSPYARVLLELLAKIIVKPAGKRRLARHYRSFKAARVAEICDFPVSE